MNKRLVWNFEINADKPLKVPSTTSAVDDLNRWEARFFWPDDRIITLHGLNDHFRELSRYKIKHREDTYYLLANTDYNLKIRREQLVYKPILMKTGQIIAYGKKIKLEEQAPNRRLPGCEEKDTQTFLSRIHDQGKKITVEKEALIYTFESSLNTKLELAWLHVTNKSYFTVCIESRSIQWVESITRQLLGDLRACDYVTFLKNT
jgi:hypothetical protein